jgi:voltage-gated potassium channel
VGRIHSHNNFYFFTASLVILLLVSAFVSSTPLGEGHLLLQSLIFATEVVAYFSLNLSKQWRVFVGVMLVLLLVSTLLREFTTWTIEPLIGLGLSLIFYCGMAYAAARQALFSGDIELNTIVGAIAVYLLLGLIWTLLYLIALEFWPAGIKGIEYQNWHDNFGITNYFSYVTLSTLGYGDISPAVPVTRTLAFLEAITGTFYMAVVVASMIGRVSKKTK